MLKPKSFADMSANELMDMGFSVLDSADLYLDSEDVEVSAPSAAARAAQAQACFAAAAAILASYPEGHGGKLPEQCRWMEAYKA